MEHITDLHIHSRHAAACSDKLTLENIGATAKMKGIDIIGTGDFTHPAWFSELEKKLIDADETGLYTLRGSDTGTKFVLSCEIATIFEAGDKSGHVKKVHNCVLAPSLEVVSQISGALSKFGNLAADGRPILKLSAAGLSEILHGIDNRIVLFGAHVWTPWFGALGAFSGFDSIDDAYEDQAQHVHAVETGLSSDPGMNWRVSALDKYTLLSGSDAHSLDKIGREVTSFDFGDKKPSFAGLERKIREHDTSMTVEFYPEEGKYHFDGHRNCNVSLSPEESKRYNNLCPKCRRRLTIGVLHRIEELADREEGARPASGKPYVHAVPLLEVIAGVSGMGVNTKRVRETYDRLIRAFGSEMGVLLKCDADSLEGVDEGLGNAISRIRDEKVNVIPGYDGVFGIVDIKGTANKKTSGSQRTMQDF
jgi:uncharacterized protein (TIGR00375 family)